MKQIPVKEYNKMDRSLYIQVTSVKGYYRRLATIIPLYTSDQVVVPIPCSIDTDAPATLVMGSAALKALQVQGLIRGEVTMALKGTIKKNNNEIKSPIVTQLPIHYENVATFNDVRYNLLGIHALQDLQYTIDFKVQVVNDHEN